MPRCTFSSLKRQSGTAIDKYKIKYVLRDESFYNLFLYTFLLLSSLTLLLMFHYILTPVLPGVAEGSPTETSLSAGSHWPPVRQLPPQNHTKLLCSHLLVKAQQSYALLPSLLFKETPRKQSSSAVLLQTGHCRVTECKLRQRENYSIA